VKSTKAPVDDRIGADTDNWAFSPANLKEAGVSTEGGWRQYTMMQKLAYKARLTHQAANKPYYNRRLTRLSFTDMMQLA
jgi:hypothetical protein